jgi:hypothetical protein
VQVCRVRNKNRTARLRALFAYFSKLQYLQLSLPQDDLQIMHCISPLIEILQ